MEKILAAFRRAPPAPALISRFRAGASLRAEGLWGSARALAAAAVADADRPLLVVLATPEAAETFADDLDLFGVGAEIFPAWNDRSPRRFGDEPETLRRRLGLLCRLAGGEAFPPVLLTDPVALCQPVPAPAELGRERRAIASGDALDPGELAAWLTARQYRAVDLVEAPGEFARRGGVFDLYPFTAAAPCRLELDHDRVEEIRAFDPVSQRSRPAGPRLDLWGLSGRPLTARMAGSSSLAAWLPESARVVLVEPAELDQAEGAGAVAGDYRWSRLKQDLGRFPRLGLSALPAPGAGEILAFGTGTLAALEETGRPLAERVAALRAPGGRVLVFCHNEAERGRLAELLPEKPPWLELRLGAISNGFSLPGAGVTLVGHQEIFTRYRVKRRFRRLPPARPISSFLELKPGDLVVHLNHGIARFRGLKALKRQDEEQEHLLLEFKDKVNLYVPVTAIGLVQKYVGGRERRPPLSRVGSSEWGRRKERVARALADLAGELIELQAARQGEEGLAYPADDELQRSFEAEFIYQETDDQLRALGEIKRDQQSPRPMDRLLCGDVGFGKTELAIRAAFKVVNAGRQVAVLSPTTILAQQHLETFRERLADYPVQVEMLSRFRTKSRQQQILADLEAGRVDIVIGTHRLVQPDVRFRDLGLVVIDEEQRFGVEHKERLKRLRRTVDVLTMTATPIPRTLHMSLLGLRDISTLATPPPDRRAIETTVARWDQSLVSAACRRELERGGQVYYVHNRVYDIESEARRLAAIVPEARIEVAHGQLPERELEGRMIRFIRYQADILVTTSIIESGIDIPRANTLIVATPESFGLSDLHQLRGRIGRYRERAHAYFLLPATAPLSPRAAKRLKAVEELSGLGAGFGIAMRDMEIRGVGNLLGREQHGHIAAVGYDLFCRLLEDAVCRRRNQPLPRRPAVTLELPLAAQIPTDLVPQPGARLELYRQIVATADREELARLRAEIADRFGAVSPTVERLLLFQRLRLVLDEAGVSGLALARGFLELRLEKPRRAREFLGGLGERLREVTSRRWVVRLDPDQQSGEGLARFLEELAALAEAASPPAEPRA